MTKIRSIPGGTVVTVALISEVILLGAAYAWAYFRNIEIPISFNAVSIWDGIKATGPMLAFNFGIFAVLSRYNRYQRYRDFLKEVVIPVASRLNFGTGLIVAICAGVGEEIFFRGVLNVELITLCTPLIGIIIGSYIFAHVHFIGYFKRYWSVVMLYFLFGLYLSYVAHRQAQLAEVIICHTLYDYIAIIYMRYVELANINQQHYTKGKS